MAWLRTGADFLVKGIIGSVRRVIRIGRARRQGEFQLFSKMLLYNTTLFVGPKTGNNL